MSSRPEILFPLFAGVTTLGGIGDKTARALQALDITTPRDFLFALPTGVIDRRLRDTVEGMAPGSHLSVEVEILGHDPPTRRNGPYRVAVRDSRALFSLVFFHANPKWISSQLPIGERRVVSGKVEIYDNAVQIVHPDRILRPGEATGLPDFEPVYPLTGGVSSKLYGRAVREVLERLTPLPEWIDPHLKAEQGWADWQEALMDAHLPLGEADLAPQNPARMRLAYDEFFAHQLTLALARAKIRRGKGVATVGDGRLSAQLLEIMPFSLTGAQRHAIDEITQDMAHGQRMNRLMQGDVGSGKTIVALMACLAAVEAGGQTVMMAPTEILARQHFAGIRGLTDRLGLRVELLTGRDRGRARADKLAALASGDIAILIGTHAVFQEDVHYHDLRLAIVDEQHRFGVDERLRLSKKGGVTDMLVMTATPIPRSLALAQYGDMDISVLDEKPPGRQKVTTAVLPDSRVDEVVNHMRRAISEGRQAYWVCPLVEESEVSDLASAENRFQYLRAELGEGAVGLVHGQMPPEEKDAAMAAFLAGETAVLVATTVIEVGVDVPNATIMVIERAEHFGLAQLHQLRGRVGRGSEASTCLLLYQPPLTESGQKRLGILRETEDGFKIAEADLTLRGAGDMIGVAQSGLPRFRIGNLEHQAGLMKMAQDDARNFLRQDPNLQTARGFAVRVLLWLMRQDEAIRLISVG
ncbi:MAG: ATP-dependent DNA helicase RecG [Rhodobacterales bacterium]|nr:MAG: ATP-dependent DNA helicase RecG [Rhodobacterales bacterium]